MEITSKNCKVAEQIIEVLAREGCTVNQSIDILCYVRREIQATSTVHFHPSMITDRWFKVQAGGAENADR